VNHVTETEAFKSFFQRLELLDIPYLVGGSVASSAHGHPRQTNDIDIAIQINETNADLFVEEFQGDFMLTDPMVREALSTGDEYRSFQMIHYESLLRIDCFLPIGTPLQQSEFARRVMLEILPGLEVPVASAEDIVIRKLLWFQLGGHVSDRQWNDIIAVLDVQGSRLDNAYLDEWTKKVGVYELLTKARTQVVD
jgi:hypothetical protein